MELSFEEIKPYLSERGALEVELAAQRATVQRLNDMVVRLAAERDERSTE